MLKEKRAFLSIVLQGSPSLTVCIHIRTLAWVLAFHEVYIGLKQLSINYFFP